MSIIRVVDGTIDSPGPEGVFRLRWARRNIYLLWRGSDVTLIGAGGPGHMPLIEQALNMRGQKFTDIKAVLLTHADTILTTNARIIRERSKALVYINRLEASRLLPDSKIVIKPRLRRWLERRRAEKLGYKATDIDIYIADGDLADIWYGLTVIGLPGPSIGHCGFYCRHLNILFCGALRMQNPAFIERLQESPPYDIELLEQSRAKVAKMNPGMLLES